MLICLLLSHTDEITETKTIRIIDRQKKNCTIQEHIIRKNSSKISIHKYERRTKEYNGQNTITKRMYRNVYFEWRQQQSKHTKKKEWYKLKKNV